MFEGMPMSNGQFREHDFIELGALSLKNYIDESIQIKARVKRIKETGLFSKKVVFVCENCGKK